DHVAAVTCTRRADTTAIYIRTATQHVCNAIHQVDVNLAAPVTADVIHKLLPVTGRTPRVRRKHDVTGVRKHLRVPAITPVIIPRALWSTVNQDDERILLARIEVIRLHDETVNLLAE